MILGRKKRLLQKSEKQTKLDICIAQSGNAVLVVSAGTRMLLCSLPKCKN